MSRETLVTAVRLDEGLITLLLLITVSYKELDCNLSLSIFSDDCLSAMYISNSSMTFRYKVVLG